MKIDSATQSTLSGGIPKSNDSHAFMINHNQSQAHSAGSS